MPTALPEPIISLLLLTTRQDWSTALQCSDPKERRMVAPRKAQISENRSPTERRQHDPAVNSRTLNGQARNCASARCHHRTSAHPGYPRPGRP